MRVVPVRRMMSAVPSRRLAVVPVCFVVVLVPAASFVDRPKHVCKPQANPIRLRVCKHLFSPYISMITTKACLCPLARIGCATIRRGCIAAPYLKSSTHECTMCRNSLSLALSLSFARKRAPRRTT